MTSRRTRAPWLALFTGLAITVLTVACGGGDDDDAPSATQSGGDTNAPSNGNTAGTTDEGAAGVDSCELLAREEVEEALGQESAEELERSNSEPYETCTWNTKDVSLMFVIVQVQSGVSLDDFLEQQASAGAFLSDEVNPLDGLGDAAYEVTGFIYAHQGNYEVVMTNLLGFDPGDPDEAAQALEVNRTLMESALSRLP